LGGERSSAETRDPTVTEDVDPLSIAHTPRDTLQKQLSTKENRAPGIRGSSWFSR
jgi:hypothetical protein